jgi:hypothetical protein
MLPSFFWFSQNCPALAGLFHAPSGAAIVGGMSTRQSLTGILLFVVMIASGIAIEEVDGAAKAVAVAVFFGTFAGGALFASKVGSK